VPLGPRIRVAVVDAHAIFRRGVVACLADDPLLEVVAEAASGPLGAEADVVVASPDAAVQETFRPPLVVCTPAPAAFPPPARNRVLAVLPRGNVTPVQLLGAVRAAAAGLEVKTAQAGRARGVDHRGVGVLRLLAEGAGTREISQHTGFSERTIKQVISEVEQWLGARSRAQAVAEAIRRGLI
jgi:DNA-binding NarL/FixJ family response regulator